MNILKKIYDQNLKDYVLYVNSPSWIVTEVQPREDYTLLLTFVTGEKKIYDARPLLKKSIYTPLKNLSFFMQAKVDGDSVIWNDEIDIAPEHLYEASIPVK